MEISSQWCALVNANENRRGGKRFGAAVAMGFLGLAQIAAVLSTPTLAAQTQSANLQTLTTARAAHELTLKEAARHYPVRLTATVTYYDPYIDPRRPAMFVTDGTGAIFVALSGWPAIPLKAGELVEVVGVSGPGDFAPIVMNAEAPRRGRVAIASDGTASQLDAFAQRRGRRTVGRDRGCCAFGRSVRSKTSA